MPKTFVVSLHRCAAQSTELFLKNAGLKTCHWPAVVDGVDYQSQIVGSETARKKIVRILKPVFDAYDAVSDVPLPALYRELDEAYPDARFVAIYRNPFDWIRSVRRHCADRPLDAYERVQYWRYLDDRPERLEDIADDVLLRVYLRHYSRLAAYFHGRQNFLLVDLGDREIGAQIASFLGVPPAEFPRVDFKDSTVREYTDLVRWIEEAQRWLLEVLDPALLTRREIAAVPESWPPYHENDSAAHKIILARLLDAGERANRLGLAFLENASDWRGERSDLERQLRDARRAFETAIGERDRARDGGAAAAEGEPAAPPLVSIVLPVYNQAYLVDEAIAGVLAQTYRNWELIVIDDGSTDDLEARVREYRADRRVLFLRQPNRRLPAALNAGFAHARGELLTWTSADNVMLPTQIERLVAELGAHPEAGLVYSDYWAIDDKGAPLDEPDWRSHNRDPEFADLIRLPAEVTLDNFHRTGDNFIGASFLYRRAIADIVGRYADDAFGGEDYDFWLRMHLVTQFRHVAEPLYKYRVHADTLTRRAAELGLYANIQEVLAADRWRIETLLADGTLHGDGALLRPTAQFHGAIVRRCRPAAPRDDTPHSAGDAPAVVDIDAPPRAIDSAVLAHADILLCRSALTESLVRREVSARGKRVLAWSGEMTPAAQHAFVQSFAERANAPAAAAAGDGAPAAVDEAFQPARLLLIVERWSSGGLENVVVDLALALAASGRTVIVACADGPPPPPAAFAAAQIRTLSFFGSEDAFDACLRREAIEAVNYHHSRFAVRRAKSAGAATVYTMHNSYLWMDGEARARVAEGLAEMDRLVAVSRQVAQFAVAQFDFPAERIAVVPNALPDAIARRARALPRPPALGDGDAFTVAMVGSFARHKLQHVAIAAFAEAAADIPEMRLQLIGAVLDPPYRAEIEAQIAASPERRRIALVDGLNRAQTIAALAAAHVFLLPSLVEGCSLALIEAAAAGCVCIASDVGSARELAAAGGAIVLLPSPLGELDGVTQQQFFAAATAELLEHRANIAAALRNVWRDYRTLAAAIGDIRAHAARPSGMRQMAEAYMLAYTLAYRGGPALRRRAPEAALPPPAIERAALAAGD